MNDEVRRVVGVISATGWRALYAVKEGDDRKPYVITEVECFALTETDHVWNGRKHVFHSLVPMSIGEAEGYGDFCDESSNFICLIRPGQSVSEDNVQSCRDYLNRETKRK